jgi:polyphenol oxidase
LVVQMADCAPLILLDPTARVLGVAHAGWRGATAGIAGATVDAMVSLGAEPARIHAAIGPCVDPTTYEVGPEVIEAVEQLHGAHAKRCVNMQGARAMLDLGKVNELAFEAAGIPFGQVHRSTYSTADRHLFFSDRHARPCGRFALFARLSDPDQQPVASGVR